MSLPEAAALIGISRQTAYQRAKATGELNGVPVVYVTRRKMVVSRAAIERAISETPDRPAPPSLPWDQVAR